MPETKEWTLMFYFASDNPLAPGIVSQLKALKNAGFHPDANVIARFDPHTEGTPIHTFDINRVLKVEAFTKRKALQKLKDSVEDELRGKLDDARDPADHKVGFSPNDPYIRNLVLDKLWGDATTADGEKIEDLILKKIRYDVQSYLKNMQERHGLTDSNIGGLADGDVEKLIDYNPPDPMPLTETSGEASDKASGKASDKTSDESDPARALDDFLQLCAKQYPARHYMLFILGHGLVVGNAMFLYDAHAAKPSLLLGELNHVLSRFNEAIKADKTEERVLELIAFHSCSMSSIEVAHELQDHANYMMASQGPEFVGSIPYTQILIRIFNDLVHEKKDIKDSIKKIFSYCFYNSYDFQLAGYSFDLALCDLSKMPETSRLIRNLSSTLKDALDNKVTQGLILLAHWDAQSFWRDTYTDLFDFCLCLKRRCIAADEFVSKETEAKLKSMLKAIQEDCDALMDKLLLEGEEEGGVILCTGFAGPSHQYSHGLSVFFPWSEPGNKTFWHKEYKEGYAFKETGWHEFLKQYFDKTMRDLRRDERGHRDRQYSSGRGDEADELDKQLLEAIAAKVFAEESDVQLDGKGGGGDAMGKGGGGDATGKGGGGDAAGKGGGGDASGDDCDCPPIKNYPSYTRVRHDKETGNDDKSFFGVNPTTLKELEGNEPKVTGGNPTFLKLPQR